MCVRGGGVGWGQEHNENTWKFGRGCGEGVDW